MTSTLTNPKALISLALAFQDRGKIAEAVSLLQKAVALAPDEAKAHYNLGVALERQGRPAPAMEAYRAAITRQPGLAEAHSNLASCLLDCGQVDEAIGEFHASLAAQPDNPRTHYNLAVALRRQGRLGEALAACGAAIRLRPDFPEALTNLGIVLVGLSRPAEAVVALRRALILRPQDPRAPVNLGIAWNNWGVALLDDGKLADSETAFLTAIDLNGNHAEAYSNLGNAYYHQGRFAEAAAAVRRALALQPDFVGAHDNLGVALQATGQVEDAIAAYRAALARKPDHPPARYNLATALLLAGDYQAGWEEYEWRWKGGVRGAEPRGYSQPLWMGGDLAGRTLLVHAEQGLGDTIQFARYLPILASRGIDVVMECHPPLKRLFASLPGNVRVVAGGEPLPNFDCHVPLMSLPHRLGTTLDSVPGDVPYLTAEDPLTAVWGRRLSRLSGLKVGLVWAGNPRQNDPHANALDRRRSIPLASLTPLLELPGVSFVSLQKGEPAAQIRQLPAELRPLDLMADVDDFADTAALVANLDLVISVDTAVAHLAGAMGKPVWIASRFDGCWRWLTDRDDSPWYPTVRLFRQTRPGDWDDVAARLAAALASR